MNNHITEALDSRAKILYNIEGLYAHGLNSNKNKQQLSLFGGKSNDQIELRIPGIVNYEEMIEKEREALGVYLTYNPFDTFILTEKRFCNHNIESMLNISEDKKNGIILLARILEIKQKVSNAQNNYAKVILGDYTSNYMVYLWGKQYNELLRRMFLNRIYLVELGFKHDGNTFYIVNIKDASEINIEKFVKTIYVNIPNLEAIPKVRKYVFENMIGSKYSLVFVFNDIEYKVPYKVNFNANNFDYFLNNQLMINVK